jgi:hypothetical protein
MRIKKAEKIENEEEILTQKEEMNFVRDLFYLCV